METRETKIFWRTSEFWVMVLTNVLALAAQIAGTLPPEYGIPTQALVNALYALARGLAKQGVAPQPVGPTVVVTPPPPVVVDRDRG